MKEKILLVLATLENGFPGRKITHQSNSNDHIFLIDNNGLTHCLCIPKEFLDNDERILTIKLLNATHHIVDVFKIVESPLRLLLTNDGVKEVPEAHCS